MSYFEILRIDLPLVSDIELIQVIGRVHSENLGLKWLKTHNICKTLSLHLLLCMIKSMSERIYFVKKTDITSEVPSLNPLYTMYDKSCTGIWQQVKTQMKCHITWHFICVFTVCKDHEIMVMKNLTIDPSVYCN